MTLGRRMSVTLGGTGCGPERGLGVTVGGGWVWP